MNIAIFGGSFDPPHIGHELIINKSLELLDIDKLYVVPTYLNPFKKEFHLTPNIRFELLDELFGNTNVEVLDYEVKQEKAVASIDTVRYLKKKTNAKKIYLIIGSDNLEKIHLWKDFDKLNQLVSFVVITRNSAKQNNGIIKFKEIQMDIDISSSSLREKLDIDYIPVKIQNKVRKLWKQE